MEFSLNEWKFSEFSEFKESNKTLKHNLAQFKDPVFHMCLAGIMVASQSLTQELVGLSPLFTCNDKYFVSEFSEVNENLGKTQLGFHTRID